MTDDWCDYMKTKKITDKLLINQARQYKNAICNTCYSLEWHRYQGEINIQIVTPVKVIIL